MKRNNFLVKCLITVITSAMLLLCLPLAGYCSEPLGSAESTSYEDDTVSANTSSCDAPIYEDSLTITDGNDGLTEEKSEEIGIFDAIYGSIRENLADILSALAFLGSLIVMLCYKKGLLPFIKEALAALSSGVRSISEKTASLDTETAKKSEEIEKRLAEMESLSERLFSAADSLVLSEKERALCEIDKRRLSTILECQIDMLFEVLSAAALPQYLKERAAERLSAMKKEIKDIGGADEENG